MIQEDQSAKVEHEEPVSGEWRRGKLLGEGPFGLVHMAMVTEPRAPRFKDFPPVMAVKTSHEPFRAQLENEKLILRLLRGCPYVIQYLGEDEIFAEDGISRLYLFLELASGGTLDDLIEASKGQLLEASVVRRHTRSVLAGLKRIHDEGYVHCSLNSENILLVEEGHEMVAKLADFSLVKQAGEQRHARGSFAPEGWTLGVQEKPSDIWSLGCVVLQMLGGRMQGMMQFLRPVLPEGLSREAVDFLGKCLATKPEDRATVEELMSHPFVCPDKAKKLGGQRRRMQWKECLYSLVSKSHCHLSKPKLNKSD